MTREEAQQVVDALRSGREFTASNSMYGKWSFAYEPTTDRFRYRSEFWGDDPEHPQLLDESLSMEALVEKLSSTYSFAPHFAKFLTEHS